MGDWPARPSEPDRDRLNASLNDILIWACDNLAHGWEIRISATGGCGASEGGEEDFGDGECSLELYDPSGECVSKDWDTESTNVWNMVDYSRNPKGDAEEGPDLFMHIAVTDEERAAIESALKRFPSRSVGPYEGGALAAICRWWELAQLHPLDPNANHPPHLSGDELFERLMRAVGEGDGAKS